MSCARLRTAPLLIGSSVSEDRKNYLGTEVKSWRESVSTIWQQEPQGKKEIIGSREMRACGLPPPDFLNILGRPHFPARDQEVSPSPQSLIVLLLAPRRSRIKFPFSIASTKQ